MEFRRTTRSDFPLLARWLGSSHVARFWNHETTPEAIERDFGGSVDGTEPSFDFIVEDAGVPVGCIQCSAIWDYADEQRELIALTDAPRDALTIDYFIGEVATTGKGIGTQIIQEFTELCFADCPSASAIIVTGIAAHKTPNLSHGLRQDQSTGGAVDLRGMRTGSALCTGAIPCSSKRSPTPVSAI